MLPTFRTLSRSLHLESVVTLRSMDCRELERWKATTTSLYEQHAHEIAAVIIEPILQGAGGMHVYDPEAVRHLVDLARAHGALVIFDEIATGFWRTGTAWAADRCGVTPDIMCVGKAPTGGYLTLGCSTVDGRRGRRRRRQPGRRHDARPEHSWRTRSPVRLRSPASTCSTPTTMQQPTSPGSTGDLPSA